MSLDSWEEDLNRAMDASKTEPSASSDSTPSSGQPRYLWNLSGTEQLIRNPTTALESSNRLNSFEIPFRPQPHLAETRESVEVDHSKPILSGSKDEDDFSEKERVALLGPHEHIDAARQDFEQRRREFKRLRRGGELPTSNENFPEGSREPGPEVSQQSLNPPLKIPYDTRKSAVHTSYEMEYEDRARRERILAKYDEGFTEEQWLDLVRLEALASHQGFRHLGNGNDRLVGRAGKWVGSNETSSQSSREQGPEILSQSSLHPCSKDRPDTLVFIDYPKTAAFQEFTAPYPLHVHSANLLKSGSKVFRDLLSPTRQFRTVRRRNVAGHLPDGIKYVLDLTPPEEGDDAVNLIADLSLSLGIRQWYTMVSKTRITNDIAGGSDESADADLVPVLRLRTTVQDQNDNAPRVDWKPRSAWEEDWDFNRAIALSAIEGLPAGSNPKKTLSPETKIKPPRTRQEEHADLQTALLISQTYAPRADHDADERERTATVAVTSSSSEVPEYSDVRHRLGIHRLLQVLEGREPDLDSAPKVWTLWTLAKYFDCTSSVVDCIRKWILAYPNNIFVEVLPEMSAKIGLGLQDPQIAKIAFCILVGEEALSLLYRRRKGSGRAHSVLTLFGRRREDVDEDLKNRIEYASQAFEERISKTFDHMFSKDLLWLESLPEFKKIMKFQQAMNDVQDDHRTEWAISIDILRNLITSLIRRRILCALNNPLTRLTVGMDFIHHRYYNSFNDRIILQDAHSAKGFLGLYDELSMQERLFTRPFWTILENLGFTLHDLSYTENLPLFGQGKAYATEQNIGPVTNIALKAAAAKFDEAILEAVSLGFVDIETFRPETVDLDVGDLVNVSSPIEAAYIAEREDYLEFLVRTSGHLAPSSPKTEPTSRTSPTISGPKQDGCHSKPGKDQGQQLNEEIRRLKQASQLCTTTDWWNWPDGDTSETPTSKQSLADDSASTKTLRGEDINTSDSFGATPVHTKYTSAASPFFNLSRFLNQVDEHCKEIIHTILSTENLSFERGSNGNRPQTLDVLVSLTDNEYKYLPVFAGGQDDGTGAVFTDPVPEGVSGVVPIGPGPFFKTGYSAVGSSIGTDSDSVFGSEYTDSTYEGSAMVEDGYSGVFPRTRVMKDSDIASLALSDTGTEVRRGGLQGKGKAKEMGPVLTPGTSVVSGSVVGEDVSVRGSLTGKNGDEDVDHNMDEMDHDFGEHGEEDDDSETTIDNTEDADDIMEDEDDIFEWDSGDI